MTIPSAGKGGRWQRVRRIPIPLIVLVCWAATLCLVRTAQWLQLGFPLCTLRLVTGIPCPTCGGTRALLAWSHLNLPQAFRFNPLVSLGCLGVWLGFGIWLSDYWFNRARGQAVWYRLVRMPWVSLLVGATLANWIYLLFFLPR